MAQLAEARQLLLVNSNPDRLKTLEALLKNGTDFEILTASNAKEAVELLKAEIIHFVVSNIKLPDFDGWRLARLVRSGVLRCAADTPFVIVANTWCQHIASTTAREFGINRLIAFEENPKLLDIINGDQLTPLEDMKKASVLVIEDNQDTRHLVTRILNHRFQIEVAEDGESGLEKWRQRNYSLVLLDVMLPGISGNQVLGEILKETPSQSVVIMTANHTMELAEELMLKGAADFVTKPFRAEQLRRVCETAARREDFIISNEEFAAKVDSLNRSRKEYKRIFEAHQHLLDQLGSVVIELNTSGHICFLNRAWEKLTGYAIQECHQRSLLDFMVKPDTPGVYISNELDTVLSGNVTSHRFEFRLKNKFKEELWVEARFEITLSKDHKSRSISGTIDNVTARKKAQRDLEYLAMHDGLTGLFNRHYFETELRQFTATASRGNGPHSLLYIDLDHFKVINDTLGHHHGDIVLRNISSLVTTRLRESDILSRIGGDEFALLLPNTNQQTALMIADDICRLLDDYQCSLEGQSFKVNCSIGISEISGVEASAEEYMKQADIALYAAKKQGRNLAHVYDKNDTHSKALQASLEWARKLHQAVADDNLELYFQPVVEIASRQTVYHEALVRLKIENRVVSPGEFIPALEREGDMNLLDRQVVSKAIKYLHDYPSLNKIAINLSAQGFGDERLVPLIKEKLRQHRVDGRRIIFELTESASLSNITATRQIVSKIRELGCEFSIDDFGTGFSTFNYLKQLPAQSVKIDGSFIVDLTTNAVDLALVKAIYEVATALDKKTVAEFVENEQTLILLKKIGVTYAQGYHLGKPLPVEKLFAQSAVC
ncbi:GGDEF/EAL domain-containing response regulator [Aliikangiella coralliicola]|uniref:EAL domain-containing protein n=1 Tax=Aliikangiella coralliicola TaxID=2592383 RepID=A0A545U506_9GAMM|nr:EAL domain-containing protein [Aliikangiella coralliicola]TQV84560.1 EAL domain-containing protein [Aliikangiella coralliicola]